MPVSRRTAEGLARTVAAVYERAEVRLLQLIATHLAAGHDAPAWAEAKLAELQVLRRRAQAVIMSARREAVGELVQALQAAYLRGAATGNADAEALLRRNLVDLPVSHAEHSVAALAQAQAGILEGLDLPILRSVEDAYRDAVAKAVGSTLTGAGTRLQDAQRALDDLASRGLSGFTDAAGRRWGLSTYVEMATRTATAHAAVQGHLDRLEAAGIPWVKVSDSPRECPRCAPWEGKVLTRGPVSAIARNALTGESMRVPVDGTLADAVAGGLFHPNCTHSVSGYVPGATSLEPAQHDPAAYVAQQQQRAMERKVREWKRREAAAITPEAQRKARAKVRGWQGQIKDHVAAHDLPRKRNRESLTAAR